MSLIERAAKRLEELRKAGVEIPVGVSRATHGSNEGSPHSEPSRKAKFIEVTAETTNSSTTAASRSAARSQPVFELDLRKLAALGFVTPDMPRSRIADEFRVLKRPLIANTLSKRPTPIKHANLIMVTSSVPGEGKTFTAFNLAMSLAMELEKTVLLVDADVARPALPTLLGMSSQKGLLDVLEDRSLDVGSFLRHTSVEKLSILPSGTPSLNATELLASGAMTRLLDEISARYKDRIIVFGSPPLLVTTEARVLATQMGQIVFVVHAESTFQSDVKRALAMIESCQVKMMVLNQARTAGQGAYGYGYGYGYGG